MSEGGRQAVSEGQRRRWKKVKDTQRAVIESARSRRRHAKKQVSQQPINNDTAAAAFHRPKSMTGTAQFLRDQKRRREPASAGQCLRTFLLQCDRDAVARLPLGIIDDLSRAFGRRLILDMGSMIVSVHRG